MDGTAELITFATGDGQLLPDAVAQLVAVDPAPGCAIVAGCNDFIVTDNDGAIVTAAAGGALQNGLGDVEILVCFNNAFHGIPPKQGDFQPYYTDFSLVPQVFFRDCVELLRRRGKCGRIYRTKENRCGKSRQTVFMGGIV